MSLVTRGSSVEIGSDSKHTESIVTHAQNALIDCSEEARQEVSPAEQKQPSILNPTPLLTRVSSLQEQDSRRRCCWVEK
jgi:hypothetical protein